MDEFAIRDYPAVLWRKGYVYLASTPLELCAHPRSLFEETVARSHAGEWRVVDANGQCFEVVDWRKISPFGGVRGLGLRLLGTVFAAPVLRNQHQLTLKQFKDTLEKAIRSKYAFDVDKDEKNLILRRIRSANSYKDAVMSIPFI
jgi:hypothetical protein